jgi:2,6-dihydroxypseudooxynicotine hydrolase
LTDIRSLKKWSQAWKSHAQTWEEEGQRLYDSEKKKEAAPYLFRAALFYHYGQFISFTNVEQKLQMQKNTQELYRKAAPFFDPPARAVKIPFRSILMPGYLRIPQGKIVGMMVFVNGANSVKEELHRLSDEFIKKGYVTLTYDDPGVGETWPLAKGLIEQEQVASSIMDYIENSGLPSAATKNVGLMGISLGGWKVVRMGAFEKRISAIISVSGPFDARSYYDDLLPFVQDEISFSLGNPSAQEISTFIDKASLVGIADKIKVPVFVAGGENDVILPGREAERIFNALSQNPQNHLGIYDANHVCIEEIERLIADVQSWLSQILRGE